MKITCKLANLDCFCDISETIYDMRRQLKDKVIGNVIIEKIWHRWTVLEYLEKYER